MTFIESTGIDLTVGVAVSNGTLFITDFIETDLQVVSQVEEAEDRERTVHELLRLGATARAVAGGTLDSIHIRQELDAMQERMSSGIDEAVGTLNDHTSALLDQQTGAIPSVLKDLHGKLEQTIGKLIDPQHRGSAVSQIAELMESAQRAQEKALKDFFDAGDDNSPLARVQRDITRRVEDRFDVISKELADIKGGFRASEAAAAQFEKTTLKGATFEEMVDEAISHLAATHGDMHERTGEQVGLQGTKKGDEVVTLNVADTSGLHGAFVFEDKARKLSFPKTIEELDAAMANRGAKVGIAVFDSQDNAPTKAPFHHNGTHAIVVLDRKDPDPDFSALRLAYMWGRMTTRSLIARDTGVDELDMPAIEEQFQRAQTALDKAAQIRGAHTGIRKQVDTAGKILDTLTDEVEKALSALNTLLVS